MKKNNLYFSTTIVSKFLHVEFITIRGMKRQTEKIVQEGSKVIEHKVPPTSPSTLSKISNNNNVRPNITNNSNNVQAQANSLEKSPIVHVHENMQKISHKPFLSDIVKHSQSSILSDNNAACHVPDGVRKKGNTYYTVDNKLIQDNVKTVAEIDEAQLSYENPVVGITLNNTNLSEEKTPEQKHVNMATINPENNEAEVFGYTTSSAGHSTDKHDHGTPKNIKLGPVKMDESFVPQIGVKICDDNNSNIDFISTISVSQEKGGQYFKPSKEIMFVKQDDYRVSELGTDYVHNNPEVEKNLLIERTKIINLNKPTKQYNPSEKKNNNNEELN